MTKFYYKLVGIVLFLVAWFGFIGPYCISAALNETVFGYIIATVLLAFPFVKFVISTFVEFFKSFSKNPTKGESK
jgi:hypothetical protein